MPIEFRCVSCNRLLRTGDETAGQQAKCPECEAIQTIPTPDVPSPEAPAAGQAPFQPLPGDFPRTDQAGTAPFGAPGQFPPSGAPPMGTASVVPADLRAYALQRVSGPGMALIVLGVLGIVSAITLIPMQLAGVGGGMPAVPDPNVAKFLEEYEALIKILNVVLTVLGIGATVLIFIGGIKMRKLESRGLCITAAVLATVPCISPCCCLGLPFGIWALTVLLDKQVSAAFG